MMRAECFVRLFTITNLKLELKNVVMDNHGNELPNRPSVCPFYFIKLSYNRRVRDIWFVTSVTADSK